MLFGLSIAEAAVVGIFAVLFIGVIALLGRLWYRLEFAPKKGSLAHIGFEAHREDVVGKARIDRLNQLKDNRPLYMILEMGPELVREINKGDGVKIRLYDLVRLFSSAQDSSPSSVVTAAQFMQLLKDFNIWDSLSALFAKKNLNLEELFAPKPEPASTDITQPNPKLVDANTALPGKLSVRTTKPPADMRAKE